MNCSEKVYVFFLDIDGTLLGKSETSLKKNFDVIEKVRSLGHKVLINTGRSTAYLPDEVQAERMFDGVVSGTGARIVLDGKEIFSKLIDVDAVRRFTEVCIKKGVVAFIEGVEKIYCMGTKEGLQDGWIYIDKSNMAEYITDGIKVEKFSLFGDTPAELRDAMGEEFAVIQHADFAEVHLRDCTKAGGIKKVMKALGLPMESSVAIGDSMNDFDMIKCAGIGVAMENAIPEIKEISTMETDHVDRFGVAKAMSGIVGIDI